MSRGRALDASGDLPAGAAIDDEVSAEAAVPAPSTSRRTPWWPWLLLAAVLSVALVVGSTDVGGPRSEAERASSLTRSLKCPVCAGQSVAESDVVVSREIRRDVIRRIEEGQTDEQIRSAYVAAYGQDILLSPPTTGTSALVWLLPVAGVVLAGVGLVLTFRRWRRDAPAAVTDDDRSLVADALAGADAPALGADEADHGRGDGAEGP